MWVWGRGGAKRYVEREREKKREREILMQDVTQNKTVKGGGLGSAGSCNPRQGFRSAAVCVYC